MTHKLSIKGLEAVHIGRLEATDAQLVSQTSYPYMKVILKAISYKIVHMLNRVNIDVNEYEDFRERVREQLRNCVISVQAR